MSTKEQTVTLADIEAAAVRIGPHVIRTPSIPNERIAAQLGCTLYFKAENLQHIGAFKTRGAINSVMVLDDAAACRGVVTHSSGNHAAALARAARIRGVPAYIVMPQNAARNKIESVRAFGIEPVFCGPTSESRAETAARVQSETGATLIHPYDYPPVIAGQGTIGLEILEQLPAVEAIVVPIGGGGLLSGVLTAIKSNRPDVQIFGAEPELADDAARSLKSGKIEMPERYDTIADGLRTNLGNYTFPIIQSLVDDIILVSEDTIREAMRLLAERAHLVVEPSGAVSVAAIMSTPARFADLTVAAVLTGGNLDFGDCRLGASC